MLKIPGWFFVGLRFHAGEDAYRIIRDRCIGCGLCISTCPAEAIRLIHKDPEERVTPH